MEYQITNGFSKEDVEILLCGCRSFSPIFRNQKMVDEYIKRIDDMDYKYNLWSAEEVEDAKRYIQSCFDAREEYMNHTHTGIFARMKSHQKEHAPSYGEKITAYALKRLHCNYKAECYIGHSDADAEDIKLDFVVLKDETLYVIEYNGKQHYEPVEKFGGEAQFIIQQEHDAKKREFCKNHNIPLLEIPYTVNTTSGVIELLRKFLDIEEVFPWDAGTKPAL